MGRARSHDLRSSLEDKKPIEGAKLWIVQNNVPVVDLEKDSIFSSNLSWLMQEALSCSGRAEGQFDYCDDRSLVQECRGLGFSPDDLSIVRLNREDLRHIKAIGISGKRSVMMACLVALYRDEGRHTMNHKSFWKALQDYELDRPWERLMDTVDDEQTAWDSYNSKNGYGYSNSSYSYSYGYGGGGGRRGGSKESDLFGTPWEGHGVTVNVICDRIPVVDLAQHSIFHGNASWLLQAATGSCSKADGLFEYCQDREVLAACKKDLRLTADEVSIARLKSRPEVKAVGTNGKRSVMLALCLVLAHNDEAAAAMLEADIEESDSSLKDPLSDIMIAMHQRIRMSKDDERSTWRSKESKGSYDYSYDYDYSYAPKRKVSRQASASRSPPKRPPRRKEKKPKISAPNAYDLDEQLDSYMAPDCTRARD